MRVVLPFIKNSDVFSVLKIDKKSKYFLYSEYREKLVPVVEVRPSMMDGYLQLKEALAREISERYEDAPLCHDPEIIITFRGVSGDCHVGICRNCLSYDVTMGGECLFVRSFADKESWVLKLLEQYVETP